MSLNLCAPCSSSSTSTLSQNNNSMQDQINNENEHHAIQEDPQTIQQLTHIGQSIYTTLKTSHPTHHKMMWNLTSKNNRIQFPLHATPQFTNLPSSFRQHASRDPPLNHDDWFPQAMGNIISKTKVWCDVMSLGPPDGLFLKEFRKAIRIVYENALVRKEQTKEFRPIILRFMFGNIIGMPVNCDAVIKSLLKDITLSTGNQKECVIRVWVGAWRKAVSWNHAKLIAVDGRYLHTGGHNLWDRHYLKKNPVYDLSLEMEGEDGGVAMDGHLYANYQWDYIKKKQDTMMGGIIDKLPDSLPLVKNSRVTISEFPRGVASVYAPWFKGRYVQRQFEIQGGVSGGTNLGASSLYIPRPVRHIPVITVGRYGVILRHIQPQETSDDDDKHTFEKILPPADHAIHTMLSSAKRSIRLALQDLGPVCLPQTKQSLPGCTWPKPILDILASRIWEEDVLVEIILSSPNSIPDKLNPTEANYGNGWDCVDVACEIVKRIKKNYVKREAARGEVEDDETLRRVVNDRLRVCFLRHGNGGTSRYGNAGSTEYEDGGTVGMHAKHFIVDDVCCYIGSQNLYVCNLAEWGVIIDHSETVTRIKNEYWDKIWGVSYTGEDCTIDEVMDGLNINRDDGQDDNDGMGILEESVRYSKKKVKGFLGFNKSKDRRKSHWRMDQRMYARMTPISTPSEYYITE